MNNKKTCFAICIALLMSFGSISHAQTAVCHTKEEILKAIGSGISAREERIMVLTDCSNSILEKDIVGEVGTAKYGEMSIRKGLDGIIISDEIEGGIKKLNVLVKYNMLPEENRKIEEIVHSWINENVDRNMPSAIKIALVNRFVADRLAYTLSWNNDDAYSAYNKRYGNSFGYADLASRCYTAAGIPNMIITGAKPRNINESYKISDGITASDLSLRANELKALPSDAIYAWNLVDIDGKWYHVDLPNFDGQFSCIRDNGLYFPEFTLNSSSEMGMRYMWLRGEFPESSDTWWIGHSPTHIFLKKIFDFNMYEYPTVVNAADFDAYCRDALNKGVKRQDFIVSPDATFGEATGPLSGSEGYRTTVTSSGLNRGKDVWHKMSCDFKYYEEQHETNLDKLPGQVELEVGDTVDYSLLSGNLGINPKDIDLRCFSTEKFTNKGEGFVLVKDGFGYIGVESKNRAKIVKIIIRPLTAKAMIDGKRAQDVEPIMMDGKIFVPLKPLFKNLGASVSYDADHQEISATSSKINVLIPMNGMGATVDGVIKPAGGNLKIIEGRSYLSTNFIVEYLGYSATWDATKHLLAIDTKKLVIN